jgi:hypothetical protein
MTTRTRRDVKTRPRSHNTSLKKIEQGFRGGTYIYKIILGKDLHSKHKLPTPPAKEHIGRHE